MKNINFITSGLLIVFIFLFNSCEEINRDQNGKLEFSVAIDQDKKSSFETLNDTDNVYHSWHILISVKNERGEFIMEDEIIPLLAFGDGFVSGKIEMVTGRYDLIKFMVIGSEGEVVYAAPLKSSNVAWLVDNPLPLAFKIRPGDVTRVIPEVLPTGDYQPGDFGYAAFGFRVVRPVKAYVVAIDDNPLRYGPTQMVSAQMTIFAPDGKIIEYGLEPKINEILLKPQYKRFHIIIENPGYQPLEIEMNLETLKNTSPDNPYIFKLSQDPYNTLFLQPGPEEGKDAMITDLDPMENFGDYKFFEASFLTESPLTVMRTKRSLIHFKLSELPKSARIEKVELVVSFEAPIWDSINESAIDEFMLWDNRLVFRQIIEPWEEDRVTWENQPASMEANQVFVKIHPEMSSNQRIYDVTSLFVPVQEVAAPNHGFIFMQPHDENPSPGGLQFASSDHPVKEMRPKLVVKYSHYPD
ncbi:MAG: DNRLRE domain-containing protein [Bacteroidota bacterium]